MKIHFKSLVSRCGWLSLVTVVGLFVVLFVFARKTSSQTPPDSTGQNNPKRPSLVVIITVDGLPQEQVTKFFDQYGEGGFKRLLRDGAWFINAHQGHATTYTAVGHAAILTGAYPYRHGVVGNDWWDRATQKPMYCCVDPNYALLDEPSNNKTGRSPRALQVTTVGDELRVATGMQARVLSVSIKDRSAIFPGGKTGMAYWLHKDTGRFVTTNYYAKDYPDWWKKFHDAKPQDKWKGKAWDLLLPSEAYDRSLVDGSPERSYDGVGLGKKFPHTVGGEKYYEALQCTPFGDDYTLEFLLAAMKGEKIGRNPSGATDLLAVSFSCHDIITHAFGPESKEVHDEMLRLDKTLATFFAALDEWVGVDRVIVALTADHGFSNSPEFFRDVLHFETGRIEPRKMLAELNTALSAKFGEAKYAVAWINPTINFDPAVIEAKGVKREDLENAAADFLESYPGIHTVFTRTQLARNQVPPTRFGLLAVRAWHRQLSGDLFVIQKQGWYLYNQADENRATHGSPWAYDTNVPLILMGKPWIKAGKYNQSAEVVDLAPTLSSILEIRPPSGCEGRVLNEVLK